MAGEARRYTFRARNRLSRARDYQAVYGAKVRKSRGPLTVFAKPNESGEPRLGLSVGRRVGQAVQRNRVKRLLREAFRRTQHGLPRGYDYVVTVRPHAPLTLAAYERLLAECCAELHREWTKRAQRESAPPAPAPEREP